MLRIYSAVNFTIPRPYPLLNPLLAANRDHLRYLLILFLPKVDDNALSLYKIYLSNRIQLVFLCKKSYTGYPLLCVDRSFVFIKFMSISFADNTSMSASGKKMFCFNLPLPGHYLCRNTVSQKPSVMVESVNSIARIHNS